MSKQDKRSRDAFTLSLGGITTITSFAAAPAIAHDRLQQRPEERDKKCYVWVPRVFRAA